VTGFPIPSCCCPNSSFFVRIDEQVSKGKYVRTHTQRQQIYCIAYSQDALDSSSNHGGVVALQKLIRGIRKISSQTSQTEKYDQLVDWALYSLQSLPGPQLIPTISHLYQSEIKLYKTYLPSWNIELVWL